MSTGVAAIVCLFLCAVAVVVNASVADTSGVHQQSTVGRSSTAATAANGNEDDCLGIGGAGGSLEHSLLCRGSRALRNALHNLGKRGLGDRLVIMPGLEIVSSANAESPEAGERRSIPGGAGLEDDDDGSLLGQVADYLRSHEINLRFADWLALNDSDGSTARDLERSFVHTFGLGNANGSGNEFSFGFGAAEVEGRKKDKGQGALLAAALMMAKMMAVLGLGAVAALAMKALGVGMAALLTSVLVGLKSLAHHGGETTHSVHYVKAEDDHHHKRRRRRRRQTGDQQLDPMVRAYSGWPVAQPGL